MKSFLVVVKDYSYKKAVILQRETNHAAFFYEKINNKSANLPDVRMFSDPKSNRTNC